MKASVIEETTTTLNEYYLVGACICVVVFMVAMKAAISPKRDLYGTVASILKDEQHIESEDAGETNSSYLFSVSISAITQHFDLNEFVQKMSTLGCSVLSTADSNNPSFRKLTVQVPKKEARAGLLTVVLAGMLIGGVCMGVYHKDKEELYKTFPFLEAMTL